MDMDVLRQPTAGVDTRPKRTRTWAIVAFACILSAGMGAALGTGLGRPAALPSTTVVSVAPTPNVLLSVRDLARLEGAAFHMERVIDLTERQTRMFGLVEATDSILLVVAGDVVAGVDLSALSEEDVEVSSDAKSVRIMLPPPAIFSVAIDNGRSRVWSRRTDFLAQRNEALESRARAEAEASLAAAARESGILERAGRNNAQTIESLVRRLGFERVVVQFRTPQPDQPSSRPKT